MEGSLEPAKITQMSWKLSRTLSEANYCKKEDIGEAKQAKKNNLKFGYNLKMKI